MLVNITFKDVPRNVREAMRTTAIRAAIKAYSIAVTPESFLIKFFKKAIVSSKITRKQLDLLFPYHIL
jgi:hypothetical protein